jgi:hypothetical protein
MNLSSYTPKNSDENSHNNSKSRNTPNRTSPVKSPSAMCILSLLSKSGSENAPVPGIEDYDANNSRPTTSPVKSPSSIALLSLLSKGSSDKNENKCKQPTGFDTIMIKLSLKDYSFSSPKRRGERKAVFQFTNIRRGSSD